MREWRIIGLIFKRRVKFGEGNLVFGFVFVFGVFVNIEEIVRGLCSMVNVFWIIGIKCGVKGG